MHRIRLQRHGCWMRYGLEVDPQSLRKRQDLKLCSSSSVDITLVYHRLASDLHQFSGCRHSVNGCKRRRWIKVLELLSAVIH